MNLLLSPLWKIWFQKLSDYWSVKLLATLSFMNHQAICEWIIKRSGDGAEKMDSRILLDFRFHLIGYSRFYLWIYEANWLYPFYFLISGNDAWGSINNIYYCQKIALQEFRNWGLWWHYRLAYILFKIRRVHEFYICKLS